MSKMVFLSDDDASMALTEDYGKDGVLSIWRALGFVMGLKEGGVVEWRCAKSMDLMAKYLLSEENGGDVDLESWGVCIFPIIRKCIARNSKRVARVIRPEELFDFLRSKTIGDGLRYVYGLRGKKKGKYVCECFGRYLERDGKLDDPLIKILSVFDGDERERINEIFAFDFEAEVCCLVSDFFCDFLYGERNGKKMAN